MFAPLSPAQVLALPIPGYCSGIKAEVLCTILAACMVRRVSTCMACHLAKDAFSQCSNVFGGLVFYVLVLVEAFFPMWCNSYELCVIYRKACHDIQDLSEVL